MQISQGLSSILPSIHDVQCPFQQFRSLRFFPTAGFILRTVAVEWSLFSTQRVTISTHFMYIYEIRQWLVYVLLQTCTVWWRVWLTEVRFLWTIITSDVVWDRWSKDNIGLRPKNRSWSCTLWSWSWSCMSGVVLCKTILSRSSK